jgi:hypothetical protein
MLYNPKSEPSVHNLAYILRHPETWPGGKIRVTSLLWEAPKVILKGEVLEVRNVDGVLHIARKLRYHDEWDPKVEPYDPYGQGTVAAVDGFIDD